MNTTLERTPADVEAMAGKPDALQDLINRAGDGVMDFDLAGRRRMQELIALKQTGDQFQGNPRPAHPSIVPSPPGRGRPAVP